VTTEEVLVHSGGSTTRRRAVLIAPGSDERKARKALQSRADEVVLDLEDAVAVPRKTHARELVQELVSENAWRPTVSVRVNALSTPWAADDLAVCAVLAGLDSVVMPKTQTAQDLRDVDRILHDTPIGIQALIETPLGIQNLAEIVQASDRLDAIILGYADLGAALGRSPTTRPEQWLAVQEQVLISARAAGVAAIDGPYLGIGDDEPFRRSCEWVRDLGYDGKWVIHPAQIGSATSAFTPSSRAVQQARRVLHALSHANLGGNGAVQLDGQMLDDAVAIAARRVIVKAGERDERAQNSRSMPT
jgi:citrate lyase subunit beta/citryl-CoA lyase